MAVKTRTRTNWLCGFKAVGTDHDIDIGAVIGRLTEAMQDGTAFSESGLYFEILAALVEARADRMEIRVHDDDEYGTRIFFDWSHLSDCDIHYDSREPKNLYITDVNVTINHWYHLVLTVSYSRHKQLFKA